MQEFATTFIFKEAYMTTDGVHFVILPPVNAAFFPSPVAGFSELGLLDLSPGSALGPESE